MASSDQEGIIDALLTGSVNTGAVDADILSQELSNDTHPANHNCDVAFKYSQVEVDDILSYLVKDQEEIEEGKYEEEIASLQEELLNLQHSTTFESDRDMNMLLTKEIHKLDMEEIETERQVWQARCENHETLETNIIDHHEKNKQLVISQMAESSSAETSLQSLETSLEDLLQRFLLLRDECINLEKGKLIILKEIETAEADCLHISDEYNKQDQDRNELIYQGNLAHEALMKELASKLAVERVAIKKMELQITTLSSEKRKKANEKEHLTKMCDELLQELNQNF